VCVCVCVFQNGYVNGRKIKEVVCIIVYVF
jgi:hypothetical protein